MRAGAGLGRFWVMETKTLPRRNAIDALNVDLDAADFPLKEVRRQMLRDGFCKFEGILSPERVERLREACQRSYDAAVGKAPEGNPTKTQGSMIPMRHREEHQIDPVFGELITHEPSLQCLRDMGYPNIHFTDGYIISKPPGGPRLFWHYDWHHFDQPISWGEEPPQLFFMYYFSDTTRENGCLRVVPESHRRHTALHDRIAGSHNDDLASGNRMDRPEFQDFEDEIDVPVKAGDLLIGDARLLHAAHANQSDRNRSLVTLWYQVHLDQMSPGLRANMGVKAGEPPRSWPEALRARVAALFPEYDPNVERPKRVLYDPVKYPFLADQ